MQNRIVKRMIGATVIAVATASCGTPALEVGTQDIADVAALRAQAARLEALADWYLLQPDAQALGNQVEVARFAQRVDSDRLRAPTAPDEWREAERSRQRVHSDKLRR